MIEIKRKPDGTRYAQPYMGVNAVTGRVWRPYKSFPPDMTDEEVQRAADEWARGLAPYAARRIGCNLSDVLEAYIRSMEARGAAPNTVLTYRKLARYTAPLAGRDVREIMAGEIDLLYDGLLDPREGGRRPLSRETVAMLHTFLSRAFRWMAKAGLIGSSPMPDAEKPKPSAKEAPSLSAGHLALVDAAIERGLGGAGMDGAVAFAAWLGLNMGLRVGEACAVRADDCRLRIPDMRIHGTVVETGGPARLQEWTKGKRARTVAIPAEGVAVVEARIEAVRAAVRRNPSRSPLVTVDGSIMRPTDVSRAVSALMHDAGAPGWASFHTLRHTHATGLLAAGEDIKTVSARLGHANAATTLRIYAHAIPDRDQRAADAFQAFKRGER